MNRIFALAVAGLMATAIPAASPADEVFRSPDGSKRIYLRDRGDNRQALVDDTGRVVGYRTRTRDGDWRYTEPDGSLLGTSGEDD